MHRTMGAVENRMLFLHLTGGYEHTEMQLYFSR